MFLLLKNILLYILDLVFTRFSSSLLYSGIKISFLTSFLIIPFVKSQKLEFQLEKTQNFQPQTSNFLQQTNQSRELLEMPLENYYNVQYFGRLYIGTHHQEIRVLFDTGSARFWIATKGCKECINQAQLYDYQKSDAYTLKASYGDKIRYGRGNVYGQSVSDKVCLNTQESKSCVDDVDFLAVNKVEDLSAFKADGLLGLAPKRPGEFKSTYIDRLKQWNIIDSKVATFHLGSEGENSKMILGSPPNNLDIQWHQVDEYSYYWQVNLSKARIGDFAFELESKVAVIDSGSSYILMPSYEYSQLTDWLSQGRKCYLDEDRTGLFACRCLLESYADFPEFQIIIGSTLYVIPPELYMYKSGFTCYFKITPQNQVISSSWILGDVFMINYITVFDFENRRVGFTKTTNLIKAPWNWKEYGYLASSLMFIIGFCMFLSAKRAEYMEKKNAKQQVLYEMADLNSTDV